MGEGFASNPLLEWWRERDDYQWRVDFLRSRGLLSTLRWLLGGFGALMGVLAAWNVVVSPGPDKPIFRIGWAVVAVVALGVAARWAFLPWPTARASATLVIIIDVNVTLSALLFGDPNQALSGITLLLGMGGYVVFFHGPRLHLVHIGWCIVSVAIIAIWLTASNPEHGVHLGVSRAVIALVVTVCYLPFLQFGFWLLQGSSKLSLTDPLTELTNRRGLAVSMKRLNATAPTDSDLCALLIDVDDFKMVNDTLGHAVGDEVLIRTARLIRSSVRADAVVVRWGGEEFLVVDRIRPGQACAVAERVRAAVSAAADPAITVSIGLATCTGPDVDLIEMISAADAAMYEAKARGGDRVVAAAARTDAAGRRRAAHHTAQHGESPAQSGKSSGT